MRRGLAVLLFLSVLGSPLTPSAFGQYPYPYPPPGYGAMPMPMPAPYGAPMYGPMPAQYSGPGYGPAPMMMPPVYLPPPVPRAPAQPRPTVYVYGPLAGFENPAPRSVGASTAPARAPGMLPSMDRNAPSNLTPVQATSAPARPASPTGAIRRTQMLELDGCGPQGCGPQGCGPLGCDDACPEFGPCDPICGTPPLRGHGQFIGEVGAYFLVPFGNSRLAYTNTVAGQAGDNDFPRTVAYGPRVSVGYLFHTGWGFRGNYFYLYNRANQSTSNADLATTIGTATGAPYQIVSPSMTLVQGIGTDQFNFHQRLDINVADAEVLRQLQVFDTTLLFSLGGRYARINQTYSATRTNPGGSNGVNLVPVDREDSSSGSLFEGWGPTVSGEFIHLLGNSNISLYGNVRGSFLFGVNRFTQSYQQQRNSVDAGVPNFTDVSTSNFTSDSRTVSIGEAELGLQYGCRFGRCYVFARAGGVFQRWWDVGSPTSANGSLSFIGGTGRLGITY